MTILIIIEQILLYTPLILGAYISISLMKLPDLSIESAYTFGAILASKVILAGTASSAQNLAIAIMTALAGGLTVGLSSSLLTQKAKIPHLLSSILTVGLFHGISLAVMGTSTQSLAQFNSALAILPMLQINPELPTLIIIGVTTTILMIIFLRTQLGFCLAAYGANPRFFEHHSISGSFVFFVGVLCANGLAGLSGYLVAQTSGFVDTTMGIGVALLCITTLILGKALSPSKHSANFIVPLVGITTYVSIQQLLLRCGFDLTYFTMVQAFIVTIILIVNMRKKQAGGNTQTQDTLGV